MRYRPSFEEFVELTRLSAGPVGLVPVYRQLIGDTLTPVSAFCKIQEGDWSFLFESVIGGERLGRYSFVGSGPFLRFQAHGTRVPDPRRALGFAGRPRHLDRTGTSRSAASARGTADGLSCAGAAGTAALLRRGRRLLRPTTPSATSSACPTRRRDDRGLPDLCFAFYDRMVIFDHINKTIAVVAHAHVDPANLRGCYDAACERVDRLVERLHQGVADLQLTDIEPLGDATAAFRSNFERSAFESAVERCKEYINAGDIFQVVLSQRLQTETRARPLTFTGPCVSSIRVPFLFYLKAGPLCLIGSSPEIMVRVEGDKVTIRPLAGTRRRGRTEEEDDRLAAELLADPKERAEHIMLVDLGRNDVGRVARYGTVQLSDVMSVERYSHVMHLCSTVTGRLQPGKTAFDALRSCLPAGTLSGAPKVRAMEIIDELEPHRRGPYGGAVGYVDFSGNMDTCIALRTLVLKGQTAYLQAGAGIVADSVPASEYEETLNKARGLLRALEMAEKQL